MQEFFTSTDGRAVVAAKRPVLRYHGGKWRLAKWVISHFPPHRCYVEPFCGAASVLMQKSSCYAEVINDLDGEVVNVFRVLRDPETARELQRALELTPFARDEFLTAYEASEDAIEQARRTVVKAFMGFGSAAIHSNKPRGMRTRASTWKAPTGFRANSNRSGTTPAHDWAHYPEQLRLFCERLQGVVIENRDALEVMQQHDGPDTLHYVDPPYVLSTRDKGTDYRHEMTNEQHRELFTCLRSLDGYVVLSGYHCELYEELFAGWFSVDKAAMADGAQKRTECLWLNPRAELAQHNLVME